MIISSKALAGLAEQAGAARGDSQENLMQNKVNESILNFSKQILEIMRLFDQLGVITVRKAGGLITKLVQTWRCQRRAPYSKGCVKNQILL